MQQKRSLSIEMIGGEPFVCLQDLINMVESSITTKATHFDFALFTLVSQLKEIKNQATPKEENNENK